jgi:hypothetical protein
MGWENRQRRRGAAPRHYKLPPPGPGLLIRQTGIAYGDGSPDVEQDTVPTRVRVYSLDGEPLEETTVDLTPGKQDDTIAVRVDGPPSSLTILERGVHIPERGCLWRLYRNSDATVPLPPARSCG